MNARNIIIRPVITERSMKGLAENKYTFEVAKSANKIEIKKAVEACFPGTKVEKVHTMNVRGRWRQQGRTGGYTASWKKAVITMAEDSKPIEFFEGLL